MKFRPLLYLLGMISCLLLTACGQLEIKVEPISANPSPFPTPIQVIKTPFSIATPSQPVNSPTPAPVITSTLSDDLHLKPGLAVRLLRTKMMSETNGWAIGAVEGDPTQHILFSSDGGLNWKDRTPLQALARVPAGGLAAAAYFASDDSAWVSFSDLAGGPDSAPLVVWRTADNGATWQESAPLDLSGVQAEFQSLSDLAFLDEQHGWIMVHVGAGTNHDYFAAFTTADGGKTWKRILDPSTQFPIMSCVKSGFAFTSPSIGWISGDCPGLMPQLFFYRSLDKGASWTAVTLPVPVGKPAGYFAQSAIACGIPGIVYSSDSSLALTLACRNMNNNTAQAWLYSTSDNGSAWNQYPLPLPYINLSLQVAGDGFLVGALSTDPGASGAVYQTVDGGATWTILTSTAWTGLPDFVDDHTGWVIAMHNDQTAFVYTRDGGRTWIEIKPVTGE